MDYAEFIIGRALRDPLANPPYDLPDSMRSIAIGTVVVLPQSVHLCSIRILCCTAIAPVNIGAGLLTTL